MAVRLPNSIYIHLMKTGGWTVRTALSKMELTLGEIGRGHDPGVLLPIPREQRPFTFVFIRHPLSWYRSYWAFRMQAAWKVHPNQPITGWQTFGSVLDHECRSDDFATWMKNVLAYVPEGFLSRIYQLYTEGVDFVGRVESFQDDFCRALTLAGETFSPELIRSIPRRNVTGQRFVEAATLPRSLAEKVMATESYISERWGYHSIPSTIINGESSRGQSNIERHQKLLDEAVKQLYPAPTWKQDRGIVICGGGPKYFPGTWVCVKMLRRFGCRLPIQIWHLGEAEMSRKMSALLAPLGVETVNAQEVRERHPVRILNGWELKPYSMIHSPFREVLLLDSDNVPIIDPEFLFDSPEYKRTGAIFWPDFGRLKADRLIWKICRVEYRDEPEFETGQIVMDKQRCWKALQVAMHLNEYSDFYYRHVYGDKGTYHMAFRRLGQEYSIPPHSIHRLECTMCQHDFDGRIIFQHRNMDKWTLQPPNRQINGFQFERECRDYLSELKTLWQPGMQLDSKSAKERAAIQTVLNTEYSYHRIGHDRRVMLFRPDGTVGQGAAGCERYWDVTEKNGRLCLSLFNDSGLTCALEPDGKNGWKGCWVRFEKMPIELTPIASTPAGGPVVHADAAVPVGS